MHQFASTYDGFVGGASAYRFPTSHPSQADPSYNPPIKIAGWYALGPDFPQQFYFPGYGALQCQLLHSPSDPTLALLSFPRSPPLTSYSWSFPVFVGAPKFPTSIGDGASNTIVFSERYCNPRAADPGPILFSDALSDPPHISPLNGKPDYYPGERRATFADPVWNDVHAVTSGTPAVTRASVGGVTFQVRPQPDEANCHRLQTPYSGGLLVALADGSVRMIHANVNETAFWGVITPNGGEVASLD